MGTGRRRRRAVRLAEGGVIFGHLVPSSPMMSPRIVGKAEGNMGFVQIIKMKTSKFAEMEAAHEAWLKETEGQRTVTQELVCENKDTSGEYWIIVQFASYEDAMRNNDLPATARIAEQMMSLCDGPPEFLNLNLIRQD
jgi:hypothetical protein